ncbi:MAG: hypothetical protein HP496_10335 [Nitrospira sp.]|nr:hypothetical protein [Nitrospira sp.]
MRIFLFLSSALSLLLAAHKFSIAEGTGQNRGGLFFLLIGIQLLIIGALVHDHQEERARKSQTSAEKEDGKEAGPNAANVSGEQGKKS